jgi:hypothetical protein
MTDTRFHDKNGVEIKINDTVEVPDARRFAFVVGRHAVNATVFIRYSGNDHVYETHCCHLITNGSGRYRIPELFLLATELREKAKSLGAGTIWKEPGRVFSDWADLLDQHVAGEIIRTSNRPSTRIIPTAPGEAMCKGSINLGTGCRRCRRCREQIAALGFDDDHTVGPSRTGGSVKKSHMAEGRNFLD